MFKLSNHKGHNSMLFLSDMDGSLFDMSDRGLTKLEIPPGESPTALIADRNSITRIENVDQCPHLRQVSIPKVLRSKHVLLFEFGSTTFYFELLKCKMIFKLLCIVKGFRNFLGPTVFPRLNRH